MDMCNGASWGLPCVTSTGRSVLECYLRQSSKGRVKRREKKLKIGFRDSEIQISDT